MGHPNKVVVKLHKLLIYKKKDFTKEHIDVWPQNNEEEAAIFTAVVPFSGLGVLKVGGEYIPDSFHSDNVVTVFNPREVGYSIETRLRHLLLVYEVFDTREPNPEARVIKPFEAFSQAIAKDFNKVAIRSTVYSKRVKEHQLRGPDKMFADHARACGAKFIEICEVYSDQKKIFRPEILNVVRMNDAFARLFDSTDEEEGSDFEVNDGELENNDDEGDEKEDGQGGEEEEEEDEDADVAFEEEQEEFNEEEQKVLEEAETRAQAARKEREEKRRKRAIEDPNAGRLRVHHSLKRSLAHLYPSKEPPNPPTQAPPPLAPRLKRSSFAAVSPVFDETGLRAVVRDEYRLGDILFLATDLGRHEPIMYTQQRLMDYKRPITIFSSFAIIAHF